MLTKQDPKPPKPEKRRPRLQVPYPTVVSFKRVLKLLSKTNPGFVIERSFLLRNRIPPNAVYPVLHAFKFLGLADEEHVTQLALRRFVEDKEARAEIIGSAYVALLERLELPASDRKELVEKMKPEISSASSVVPLAATFLMWAMSSAGRPVVRKTARRRPGPKAGLMRAPIMLRGERMAELRLARKHGPVIYFQIQVDKGTTQEQIERMIEEIQAACQRVK